MQSLHKHKIHRRRAGKLTALIDFDQPRATHRYLIEGSAAALPRCRET